MNIVQMIGGVLLLLGAATFMFLPTVSEIVYGIGAVLFAWAQINQRYDGRNFVILRLRRQQLLGAALLIIVLPLKMYLRGGEWIVCLAIACVLQLYTAWRLPSELEKENVAK